MQVRLGCAAHTHRCFPPSAASTAELWSRCRSACRVAPWLLVSVRASRPAKVAVSTAGAPQRKALDLRSRVRTLAFHGKETTSRTRRVVAAAGRRRFRRSSHRSAAPSSFWRRRHRLHAGAAVARCAFAEHEKRAALSQSPGVTGNSVTKGAHPAAPGRASLVASLGAAAYLRAFISSGGEGGARSRPAAPLAAPSVPSLGPETPLRPPDTRITNSSARRRVWGVTLERPRNVRALMPR